MNASPDNLPAVGAILSGPFWPGRVRVVDLNIKQSAVQFIRNADVTSE